MKKLLNLLFVLGALVLASCEGDIGPVGPPGEPGGIEYAAIYEFQDDFTPENGYRLGFEFPNGIYDDDVVLVYILWEQVDGLDVWRLLPQTVVLDEGVIQYNFDFTTADVQVFMEFTVPENSLNEAETDNQVFRVAVVPSAFAEKSGVDLSDFNSLIQSPKLEVKSFERINLETISTAK